MHKQRAGSPGGIGRQEKLGRIMNSQTVDSPFRSEIHHIRNVKYGVLIYRGGKEK